MIGSSYLIGDDPGLDKKARLTMPGQASRAEPDSEKDLRRVRAMAQRGQQKRRRRASTLPEVRSLDGRHLRSARSARHRCLPIFCASETNQQETQSRRRVQ